MSVDDIKYLKIDQMVEVKCEESYNSLYQGRVKSINDWAKTIGVVNNTDAHKEYPPRLINLIKIGV